MIAQLAKFLVLLPLFSFIVACSDTTTQDTSPTTTDQIGQTTPQRPPGPPHQPNMVLDVETQSGTCPETIGIFTFLLGYEGGATHTAAADTWPIANTVNIVSQDSNSVTYQGKLNEPYASCVGQATSQTPNIYAFNFQDGNVSFTINLSELNAPAAEITEAQVLGFRPYIIWSIAD
ncbi:MAG: hypothetical protein ACOC04_02230 [Halothece sp.]